MNKSESIIIIGIDPGTRITGYGVIECQGTQMKALDYGCIRPPPALDLNDRYLIIHEGIGELLDLYRPRTLAVETQFMHKNIQSAMKLSMARCVAILSAKKRGIEVVPYSPSEAKRSITGNGRADKFQVQGMTQKLLNLKSVPEPEDAADALSLAICHAHKMHCPIPKR